MAPRYLLIQPLYADDQLIPEDTVIEFNGTPNYGMEPLNDEARERTAAWLESMPGGKPDLAELTELAMRERPREGEVSFPQAVKDKPIFGNDTRARRAEPKVSVVDDNEIESRRPARKVFGSGVNEVDTTIPG